MQPFHASKTVRLASTASSQTVSIPAGFDDMVIFNGSTFPVYVKYADSVAVPTLGTFVDQLICIQPNTSQTFNNRDGGGTLAYIADGAGGTLVISIGAGF
jgi:hypothetical protein